MTTWPEGRAIALTGQLAIVGLVLAEAFLAATNSNGPSGLGFIPYSAVGAVLVIRRPRTSIGWILVGMGFSFALVSISVTGTASEFADGSVDVPAALFAVVHSGLPTTALFLYAVLTMVFPSGRLPTGRWGWLARAGLGAGLVVTIAAYLLPVVSVSRPSSAWVRNPVALLPDLPIWQVITPATVIFPELLLAFAGAVSLVVRARHARGTELQQLRWIAASVAAVVSAVAAGYVIASVVPDTGNNGLAWIPAIIAFPTVPLSIGIAVLRYHLYDIDRIISRTISYGVVTASLIAVYAGVILILQAPLGAVTGGDTIAIAASTLVAAGLFQPLRRRIHGAVDRRFNRSRYDAERTAASLAAELRDEVDPGRARSALLAAVDSAIKPQGVAVWIRGES
jgi:hypothetical protein